nr:hypothetical protein Itr_chr04CG02280 [Ipomoea trifida]
MINWSTLFLSSSMAIITCWSSGKPSSEIGASHQYWRLRRLSVLIRPSISPLFFSISDAAIICVSWRFISGRWRAVAPETG